jgi:hypothetical protein
MNLNSPGDVLAERFGRVLLDLPEAGDEPLLGDAVQRVRLAEIVGDQRGAAHLQLFLNLPDRTSLLAELEYLLSACHAGRLDVLSNVRKGTGLTESCLSQLP